MQIDSYVNHDVLLSLCHWGIANLGGDVFFVKINGFKADPDSSGPVKPQAVIPIQSVLKFSILIIHCF
jgi:hypothetical protein